MLDMRRSLFREALLALANDRKRHILMRCAPQDEVADTIDGLTAGAPMQGAANASRTSPMNERPIRFCAAPHAELRRSAAHRTNIISMPRRHGGAIRRAQHGRREQMPSRVIRHEATLLIASG